jgi:hypothetical protein
VLTSRQFWLMVHLGLGIVFLHAFAGGIVSLLQPRPSRYRELVRRMTTFGMAAVAWVTVVSGTWIVYPWYRAKPPPGADAAPYPQAFLEANTALTGWHHFGMEWKEHVGWLAPILATAVAFIVLRYHHLVTADERLRRGITRLFALAFTAALISGGLGAFINKVAPNDFLR